jgi:hypothetical protein
VADKLGIDLIWFGVLLGVNMQTSFMHPPFGFALFYLRSVAARKEYTDRLTGRRMAPVTTGQIYWGAVPFVLIQIVMIGLVIALPQMVMVYKASESKIDPSKVQILAPPVEEPAPGTAPQPGSAPGSEPQGGSSETDEAQRALEQIMGGGAKGGNESDGKPPAK